MPSSEPKKIVYANHVAFDWGLTISPDPRYKLFPEIAELLSKIFKESYDVSISPKEIEKMFFEVDNQNKISWGIGVTHFNQEEMIIAELLEKLGMPYNEIAINAPLVLSLYRKKLKKFYSQLPWNQQVKDLLQFLKSKGFFISIFSNERKHTIRATLEWSGLAEFFDYIATSQEYEVQKPDVKAMQKFLEKTGFRPEETVYVGDDTIRDVKWAKLCGVKAILVIPPEEFSPKDRRNAWRETEIEEEPDAIIQNLSELKNILKKIGDLGGCI
jgi:HAD superfamily hydrolase (TIGR01662 family)